MSEENTESTQEISSEPIESTESIQEETETPIADPQPTQQEIKKQLEKFKLVVDGEEIEREFDLSDKESLKRELQKAIAFEKRRAEILEEKKQTYAEKQKLLEMAKLMEDPYSYLRKLGPKGIEASEKLMLEQYQQEMMTPEQRQLQELQQKLAHYEQVEKQRQEQEQLQQQQALEQQYAEKFQKTIIDSLTKVNLPKTPKLVQRAAELLKQNIQYGLELDSFELAEIIKQDYMAGISEISKNATPEQLIEIYGKDTIKKLMKHQIEQMKSKQPQSTKSFSQVGSKPPSPGRNRYITPEEWFELNEKRVKEIQE